MAKSVKGTQTEKHLLMSFAGESQARNKYTFYASKAKKDGYEQIAAIFAETASNEKEHAKMWFKEFHGLGDTAQNLKWAAEGENDETTSDEDDAIEKVKVAKTQEYPELSQDR